MIKIKKSRKGSFTKWAKKNGLTRNGKITGKAIAAGLKSKDARIRKKAQFSKNARKWSK